MVTAAPRLFDHDEARDRVKKGETVAAVARDMGVSYRAVWRIITPARLARDQANKKAYYAATCEVCGGYCLSVRHPAKRKGNPDGRELCARCRSDEKLQRVRFDLATNELISVRCGTRDCANGERWQDPGNFSRGMRLRWLRDGGIHDHCRSCQTRARRRYRHEHAEAQRAYDRAYNQRRRSAA